MLFGINILLIIKYMLAAVILVCIFLLPSYLAAVNSKSKYDNMRVRVSSWLFGGFFIGWIFALFVSAKK